MSALNILRCVIFIGISLSLWLGCATNKAGSGPSTPNVDESTYQSDPAENDSDLAPDRIAQQLDDGDIVAVLWRNEDIYPDNPCNDSDPLYPRAYCDGPVWDRDPPDPWDGTLPGYQRIAHLYAMVWCPDLNCEENCSSCQWPLGVVDSVWVKVEAKTDEETSWSSNWLQVELKVKIPCIGPEWPELLDEFKCVYGDWIALPHEEKFVFYCREYITDPQLIITDGDATQDPDPPQQNHPLLYVSNCDSHLDGTDEHDYSIAFGGDNSGVIEQTQYLGTAYVCHFGESLRGWFEYYGCNPVEEGFEEYQYNFKENILEIGQENVWAEVDSADPPVQPAILPVQSRPDIMFFFSHADPFPVEHNDPLDDWEFRFDVIPDSEGGFTTISPYEIKAHTGGSSDTEWIASTACSLLHIGPWQGTEEIRNGFDDWRYGVILSGGSSLHSVCGFREHVYAGEHLNELYEDFSNRLEEYADTENSPNALSWFDENHWEDQHYSDDAAVVAYMETALEMVQTPAYEHLIEITTAVDADGTWVLRNFGDDYNPSWMITDDIGPMMAPW